MALSNCIISGVYALVSLCFVTSIYRDSMIVVYYKKLEDENFIYL